MLACFPFPFTFRFVAAQDGFSFVRVLMGKYGLQGKCFVPFITTYHINRIQQQTASKSYSAFTHSPWINFEPSSRRTHFRPVSKWLTISRRHCFLSRPILTLNREWCRSCAFDYGWMLPMSYSAQPTHNDPKKRKPTQQLPKPAPPPPPPTDRSVAASGIVRCDVMVVV